MNFVPTWMPEELEDVRSSLSEMGLVFGLMDMDHGAAIGVLVYPECVTFRIKR
jgi:hypothetical protein